MTLRFVLPAALILLAPGLAFSQGGQTETPAKTRLPAAGVKAIGPKPDDPCKAVVASQAPAVKGPAQSARATPPGALPERTAIGPKPDDPRNSKIATPKTACPEAKTAAAAK